MTAQTLIIVLLATILVELTVLWYLGERSRKVLAASVVINILTNPLLNLFIAYISSWWVSILVGELLVVLVEGLWYCWFVRRPSQAFVYSLLCNAFSFLLGLLFELGFFYFNPKIVVL